VAYDVDGVRHDEMPMTQTEFHHATPIYEYFDGWQRTSPAAAPFEDLPKNAQAYVRRSRRSPARRSGASASAPGRERD
jgi:adenylosuccinate synthase